jgi:hypothetical protein
MAGRQPTWTMNKIVAAGSITAACLAGTATALATAGSSHTTTTTAITAKTATAYRWVLETDTRGVKSVTVEGPYATPARPAYANSYSSPVGLYGPYTSTAAADSEVKALGGTAP